MTARLCFACKEIHEIAYVDPISRGYCAGCVVNGDVNIGSTVRAMQFLSMTVPFRPGDRVEARTAGELYDGVGTVTDVYFDIKHGGTPVYPTFRVVIDEPADDDAPSEGIYTEMCLSKILEREPVSS